MIGQLDSFRDVWLQLLQQRVNILINVLGTVDMLQKFSYVCGIHVVGNKMKCFTFFVRHPV